MGNDVATQRARGPEPAAEKKGPAPDAGGPEAMPEGAAADPSSALTILAQSYGAQLIGVLQGAGGNAETDTELSSLEKGRQVAAQAKTDEESVDTMTDGQKVEKFGKKDAGGGGGGGGGGGDPAAKAVADGKTPPGVADPGAAAGYHAQRAGQLASLATQHGNVAAQLMAAAAAPGLAPELAGFLMEAATQSQTQQGALTGLVGSYAAVGGELAGSKFIGAAMPGAAVPEAYQARAASYQAIVSTVDAMLGEYGAALAAEQAKIAECDTQITTLQQQIAEAKATSKAGAEGKGGGAEGAENKTAPPPPSAPPSAPAPSSSTKTDSGGGASKSAGAGGGGAAKTDSKAKESPAEAAKKAGGSTGNLGFPTGPQAEGAAAKEPGASGGGGGEAAATEGLQKQIEDQKVRKQSIEAEISANEGLINTMKAYRDQMNALLTAYQSGQAPPAGGGG